MEGDNQNIALIVVGIFVFIIIVALLGFLVVNVTPQQEKETDDLDLPNFIDIKVRSDYSYKELNYSVVRQGLIIEKGVLREGIVERIRNLLNTTNYTVTVDRRRGLHSN